MLKIRRPLGRLIFNMGIAIPGKTVFLIETAPWLHKIDSLLHWFMADAKSSANHVTYGLYFCRSIKFAEFAIVLITQIGHNSNLTVTLVFS